MERLSSSPSCLMIFPVRQAIDDIWRDRASGFTTARVGYRFAGVMFGANNAEN